MYLCRMTAVVFDSVHRQYIIQCTIPVGATSTGALIIVGRRRSLEGRNEQCDARSTLVSGQARVRFG